MKTEILSPRAVSVEKYFASLSTQRPISLRTPIILCLNSAMRPCIGNAMLCGQIRPHLQIYCFRRKPRTPPTMNSGRSSFRIRLLWSPMAGPWQNWMYCYGSQVVASEYTGTIGETGVNPIGRAMFRIPWKRERYRKPFPY